MDFGDAIRDVLSATFGSDLRHAKAQALLPAAESPHTLALLATNLELAFGVSVPPAELARLATVRDVLQCVRLRRWAKRVESAPPAADTRAGAAPATAVVGARGADAAEAHQGAFRFTRRAAVPAPTAAADPPPATPGLKRL